MFIVIRFSIASVAKISSLIAGHEPLYSVMKLSKGANNFLLEETCTWEVFCSCYYDM